jgi:hypothetical protein
MIDRSYIDTLLGELAAALSLGGGLRLDEDEACAFAVDDGAIRVDLTYLPRLDAIDLAVWPAAVELSGRRVLAMMAANFCWQGAEGATLALEPRSRAPVLQQRCFEQELARGGLRAAVERMVRHARALPGWLASIEEEPGQAAARPGPSGGLRA